MRKVFRWAGAPLIGMALAGTLLPAASASASVAPVAAATTTYEIDLISLTCNKKQDAIGKDEPQLFIDGVSKFGPGSMGKGDMVVLTGTHQFTGTATMELFDVDPGNDDFLGSVTVTSAESGQGVQVETFDHLNHAEYTILYEVNPA
jgi:hypothetical protein